MGVLVKRWSGEKVTGTSVEGLRRWRGGRFLDFTRNDGVRRPRLGVVDVGLRPLARAGDSSSALGMTAWLSQARIASPGTGHYVG
jgi:hypothetical protein